MMNWDGDGGWGDHMNGMWGWFGGTMMILWMILLVVATVALVVWLVRMSRAERPHGVHGVEEPCDIINRRFARGEIDADQRRNMIETLS